MKKVIFMGTPDFAVPILEKLVESPYEVVLVVTQPDRPKGRKRILTPSPVKQAAIEQHIPVFQPEKIKDEYTEILKYNADIIITAAFGQILPQALLDAPTHGSINVHASLLPELRGGAPIHYAILQGKKTTGITIMYMTKELDAGDMIAQQSIEINDQDHVGTLHDKLSQVGADLLKSTLPSIFAGTHTVTPQDYEQATYAPNVKRELERIDWTQSNTKVYNHIRGLHPWPVAYTTHNQERLKIWWAVCEDKEYPEKTPGTIVDVNKEAGKLSVVCGNQKAVSLTSIQLAGKKRMDVAAFLKGNPEEFQIGQVLE
ncbi:MAG TPA: methionyl-tRNA formyltransferase [Pseudogracilibacillus sp.]|nr:methionyl-tRNA formyltransferase [Pseudogracilibacillus sp.]